MAKNLIGPVIKKVPSARARRSSHSKSKLGKPAKLAATLKKLGH